MDQILEQLAATRQKVMEAAQREQELMARLLEPFQQQQPLDGGQGINERR